MRIPVKTTHKAAAVAQKKRASSTTKPAKPTTTSKPNKKAPHISVTQTVHKLLKQAIAAGASDIHIEPRADHVQIRYRIDGVLRPVAKTPKAAHPAIAGHLKVLGKLRVDEHEVPQTGRAIVEHQGAKTTLHISTLPIKDGEKVVVKLSSAATQPPRLSGLGLWGPALQAIAVALVQPRGLITFAGPLSSNKSATLHSLLALLVRENLNITTIEDPITYTLHGANQVQIHHSAGLSFATGVRAALAHRPHVSMVSELHDPLTAEVTMQAALGEQLVLAGLPVSSVAASVPYLLNMSLPNFLLASGLKLMVAQHTVRRLCTNCRVAYSPHASEQSEIIKWLNLNNKNDFHYLHQLEQVAQMSLNKADDLATNQKQILQLWHANPDGCEHCYDGYRGQLGIFEVATVTPALQTAIMNNPVPQELEKVATTEGMIPLKLDGFIKILRGLTDLDELKRVVA